MPRMPDIFREAEEAVFGHRHVMPVSQGGANTAANLATQIPGAQPANPAPAPAATAPPQEDNMSFITEVEDGYAAVKAEIAKLETALPGALAKAKAAESSPFAALVEKAASALLPPEAVAVAVNAADGVLNDMIGLYQPQPPADAAPQPVPVAQ